MTKPIHHRLVEFLLADDSRSAGAAQAISNAGAWQEALALARSWDAIPALYARLQELAWKVNAAENLILKREFLQAFRQSAVRAAKAIRAIGALQDAGIPVAAFKGLASMAVLYGDPKHRAIHDADVLVRPGDLAQAVACLEESGFVRRGSETFAEYLHFVENAPGFAGNRAVTLYGPEGSEIDLHWDLAASGLPVSEMLDRRTAARLLDSTLPVVESADAFLLTVHHAIRENLAIDRVCRDLLDARRWCAHLRDNGRLDTAVERAAQSGCRVPALAVTSLLSSYDATTAASQAAVRLREQATAAERRSVARLIEIFHHQLSHGRLSKDVFYLVHSRPWRQILKGLGRDWSGYRQSMRTIEEQLGDVRPLRERAVLLAKSVPGVRGLRLARELAIVKYRVN